MLILTTYMLLEMVVSLQLLALLLQLLVLLVQ